MITAITMAVVVGIVAVAAFALFELSPFARHDGRFHEPGRRQESPRLD